MLPVGTLCSYRGRAYGGSGVARVFISYRREDCAAHAGRLADTLGARFGPDTVFMDVDAIELGIDFVQQIERAIGDSDVVVAMIGDDWLTVTDEQGRRRIDKPDDFVRIELAEALARDDVRVIPVLVEGAQMPGREELPESLAPLARRNGISLTDTRWRSDTSVLIDAIGRAIGTGQPAAPAPPPAKPAGVNPPPRRAEPAGATSIVTRYLWIVPALATFGWLTFLYFGIKANERKWVIAGFAYLVPLIAAFVVSEDDWLLGWALAVYFVAAMVAIVHLVGVRPRYLEKIERLYGT